MAKLPLLIDSDIWIDYFNAGRFTQYFQAPYVVYYSVVTQKELLAKRGMRDSERQEIILELNRYRLIPLDNRITKVYWSLRSSLRHLDKNDALIAATAISKRIPLFTKNWKHFAAIQGLRLFSE